MGIFKTTGVSKFRIFADSPTSGQQYRRGDLVKGNVYLSCVTAIKYRVISLQLICRASSWNTDPPILDKIVDYISYLKTPPVDTSTTVDFSKTTSNGEKGAVGCLPEGEYHFPFTIQLPDNALASVSAANHCISVDYKLVATVQREGSIFNNSVEQDIYVSAGMSREQYDMEATAPQQLPRAVVPMRNSLLKNFGIVECAASISGTVLVSDKPTERIQVTLEVDASGGKKPIKGAKVELQMVIQTDYAQNKCLIKQYDHNVFKPGDQYQAPTGITLKTWTEPYVKSWPTLVAQSTMLPGYIEGQASGLTTAVWERSVTLWNSKLVGEDIAIGGRGQYTGSVMLDSTDARSQEYMPTIRGEHLQVNWRIAITLDNCSKVIYMPVVVVDNIVEPSVTGSRGASLPWFHHEKFTYTLNASQQYEVPALGTVVKEEDTSSTSSTSSTVAGSSYDTNHHYSQ